MKNPTNYQKHISRNPVQRFLIDNFYKSFFEMIKPLKPISILDVGCGEGFTLKKLEEKKIGSKNEGIDYMAEAVKIANKIYPQLKIKRGDIYNLPYEDNSFDIILCTEVLEHLENPTEAIKELKRVSKKYILFSVPNEPFFIMANFLRGKWIRTFGNHPEHINHWTSFGFEKYLKNQKLSVVKSKHPFAWSLVLVKK